MRSEGDLAAFSAKHEAERVIGIRVVEHAHVWHKGDGFAEIPERLMEPTLKPV